MSEKVLRNILIYGTVPFLLVLIGLAVNSLIQVKTYETFWLLLVFIFGFVLFMPGVIVFLWHFFSLGLPKNEAVAAEKASGAPASP